MAHPRAVCRTGIYTGFVENNGIYCFRGIRYAEAPRFQPPVPVPPGAEEKDASSFGPTAIQSFLHSEPASANPDMGEDCLTLNVWTRALPGESGGAKRPVMVWIHGGSYGWGGTVDPLYDGRYLARAEGSPVTVSVEYRVNALGFSDLSRVKDGKIWTKERLSMTGVLGLMDCQEALRWVRDNIAAFGGDPDNITIFGESAGGGLVSLLMVSDGSFDENGKCLFRRVIAQSGTVNLTSSLEGLRENDQTGLILKALVRLGAFEGDERFAGWTEENLEERIALLTLDDLMALSGEDFRRALNAESGTVSVEGSSTVGGQNCFPLRTSEIRDGDGHVTVRAKTVIPADPYAALQRAAEAGVDLMIGTNGDEFRYWVNDLGNRDLREEDEEGLRRRILSFYSYITGAFNAVLAKAAEAGGGELPDWIPEELASALAKAGSPEEAARIAGEAFFAYWTRACEAALSEGKTSCRDDVPLTPAECGDIWLYTELATQLAFRMPAVLFAESYLKAGGKTYMYYFDKKADMESIGTLLGSCHACEVAYVLNNLPHGWMYSGRVDPALAGRMSEMWARFAATGIPSAGDFTVLPYDMKTRSTLYVSDEGVLSNRPDPLRTLRLFLEPFADMYKLM